MWQKQLHLCIGHDCTISFNAHIKFFIRTFVFWLQTNNLQLNLKPIVGLFHYVPRSAAVIHACEYPQCSIYLDNILLIFAILGRGTVHACEYQVCITHRLSLTFGARYSSCLWISSAQQTSACLWHLGWGAVHACEYQVCSIHRQLWYLGRGAVHDILTFVFENRVKLQFLLVNFHSAKFLVK